MTIKMLIKKACAVMNANLAFQITQALRQRGLRYDEIKSLFVSVGHITPDQYEDMIREIC